jgi:FKBP-type peptidyl-prolyl cis-trans isomerase 2
MKVEKDLVVSMHYSLKDDDGTLLDSSEGKDPLQFIFGNGMIIPGLET